ncbi:hypothetical protein B0H12DRAFT_1067182 [Mycena haematopus]|nr:hypothetical protein B0H12DRAFT_1067182 [Mycena haematopus]
MNLTKHSASSVERSLRLARWAGVSEQTRKMLLRRSRYSSSKVTNGAKEKTAGAARSSVTKSGAHIRTERRRELDTANFSTSSECSPPTANDFPSKNHMSWRRWLNANLAKSAFEGFLQQVFTDERYSAPEECRARALEARVPDANDAARPATVIQVTPPAPPATATAQEPKPKRGKKKKNPAVIPTNTVQGDKSINTAEQEEASFGDARDLNDDIVGDDAFFENACPPSPTVDVFGGPRTRTDQHWPLGMSPPLSPGTAAQLARLESGGVPSGPTMASVIDPQLLALDNIASSSQQQIDRPRPKAMYRGAVPPPPAFRLSPLFDAFRSRTPPPPTPKRSVGFFPPFAPQPSGDQVASHPFGFFPPSPKPTPTAAARTLLALLKPQMPTNPTSLVVAPAVLHVVVAPVVVAPVVVAPPVVAPPVVAPVVVAPAPDIVEEGAGPRLIFPGSRPPAKAPEARLKTVSPARIAEKEAAAKQALVTEGVKKKRGRPSKADKAAAAAAALADVTNNSAPAVSNESAPPKAPVPVYSITNNNRAAAKRAADQAKANEERGSERACGTEGEGMGAGTGGGNGRPPAREETEAQCRRLVAGTGGQGAGTPSAGCEREGVACAREVGG